MAGPSIQEQREKIRQSKLDIVKKNTEDRLKDNLYVDEFFVSGIYFLYYNDKVVYIGKSDSNVIMRICNHHNDKDKKFDSFPLRSIL